MLYFYSKRPETAPAISKLAAGFLGAGQVLVLPTDTIYGFSCRADDVAAIKHIFRIKQRDPKKALIVLVDSLEMLKKYTFVSRRQEEFLKKIWLVKNRPTTIILKSRGNLPRELNGGEDSLALRLPKSKFLIKIIKTLKKPIVSTSLNLSGHKNISDLGELMINFSNPRQYPDLVIDTGQCRRRRPSRLIDLRNIDQPLILRK